MTEEKKKLYSSLAVAAVVVALMWLVEIYEATTGNILYRWGIYPREWDGIKGIFLTPFLHSDWGHLISNSGPMFMLITMIMYFYRRVAVPSLLLITFLTGFSVWLFAKDAYHIGASGIVYGLVAFIFWSGIFRRNIRSVVLALIILVVYAGYFIGIMPDKTRMNISWESHFLGALMGIFTAFLFKNAIEKEELVKDDPWAQEITERTYFLPRDVFEKTKYQRYLEKLERQRQETLRRQQLAELRRQSAIIRSEEE